MKKTLIFIALVSLAAGCVRKETSHSLYIEPDGAVTWMVVEKDIRSDAGDRQERDKEESEFMDARRAGEHDIAQAFAEMGAQWVETRVLRDERPFMVATEARFASIDQPLQAFFDRVEAPIAAELHRRDGETRLTISCNLDELAAAEEAEKSDEEDEEKIFMSLVGDAESYRLVLTGGKFTDARGFEIVDDGFSAVLLEQTREEIETIAEIDELNRTVVYALTWTDLE